MTVMTNGADNDDSRVTRQTVEEMVAEKTKGPFTKLHDAMRRNPVKAMIAGGGVGAGAAAYGTMQYLGRHPEHLPRPLQTPVVVSAAALSFVGSLFTR